VFQDTPGYDAPTDDSGSGDSGSGYDAPATDTPEADTTPQTIITPSPAFTVTNTPTLPPDVFRTEDAEMNQSMTTPVVTETPGPTMTLVATPTIMKTQRQPTPTLAISKEKDTFHLDWGMFLAGFSLPVLGACGYILYLLDRRPELFRRFRR
jgi:hypothetical protein